jgi:hypothetical protein
MFKSRTKNPAYIKPVKWFAFVAGTIGILMGMFSVFTGVTGYGFDEAFKGGVWIVVSFLFIYLGFLAESKPLFSSVLMFIIAFPAWVPYDFLRYTLKLPYFIVKFLSNMDPLSTLIVAAAGFIGIVGSIVNGLIKHKKKENLDAVKNEYSQENSKTF